MSVQGTAQPKRANPVWFVIWSWLDRMQFFPVPRCRMRSIRLPDIPHVRRPDNGGGIAHAVADVAENGSDIFVVIRALCRHNAIIFFAHGTIQAIQQDSDQRAGATVDFSRTGQWRGDLGRKALAVKAMTGGAKLF